MNLFVCVCVSKPSIHRDASRRRASAAAAAASERCARRERRRVARALSLSLSLSVDVPRSKARRLEVARGPRVGEKRASATMTSAIAEPTRLRPRLTTFLRSAFAKSVEDVIDVDEERVRRDETLEDGERRRERGAERETRATSGSRRARV